MLLLAGCNMLQSQSKNASYTATFDDVNVNYAIFAHPDTVFVFIDARYKSTGSNLGLYLGYKVREFKGNYSSDNSFASFQMPLSDSVTITWYDGNGDSLPVKLQINTQFFKGIPFDAHVSHILLHPEDTRHNYSVGIGYYDSLAGGWCKNSDGSELHYSDTLIVEDSISSPIPTAPCTNTVGFVDMEEINSDTIPYGIVHRHYITHNKSTCGTTEHSCIRL